MKVVSLCWFAAEQQIITLIRKNLRFFYPKFIEFNQLIFNVQKEEGEPKKRLKLKES